MVPAVGQEKNLRLRPYLRDEITLRAALGEAAVVCWRYGGFETLAECMLVPGRSITNGCDVRCALRQTRKDPTPSNW